MSGATATARAASRACAWRCGRLPLALTFLPLAALECFAEGRLQWGLLGASALRGLSSVCLGGSLPRRHTLAWEQHGGQGGAILFLLGILVTASHLFNLRLCQSCPACRPAPFRQSGGT